jgi:hypothetical protein
MLSRQRKRILVIHSRRLLLFLLFESSEADTNITSLVNIHGVLPALLGTVDF